MIADAIHRLRPRWTTDELMAVLADSRIREHRNMRDTASALAWLALDVTTQSPARLLAPGQWWRNATAEEHAGPRAPEYRRIDGTECVECGLPKLGHRWTDHAYTRRDAAPLAPGIPIDVRTAIDEARHHPHHPRPAQGRPNPRA